MRRRSATVHRAVVAALAAAASLVAVAVAPARGTLDQSTMPPGGYLSPVGDTNNGRSAQAHTFVAGASGFLDTVTVAVTPQSSADGRYRLRVQGTTAQGTPNGAVLAQAIIDACRLPGGFASTCRSRRPRNSPPAPATRSSSTPTPANLPGASVSWIQGQGSAVGETFIELLDVMPLVWQPSTAGPEAYSTYMSAGAPPAAPRDTSAVTLTAQPNPVKRYRTVTITAHVANNTHPATVPAGSVRFYTDAGVSQPTAVNPSGDATITIAWPTAGDRQLAASFCPTDPVVLSKTTRQQPSTSVPRRPRPPPRWSSPPPRRSPGRTAR